MYLYNSPEYLQATFAAMKVGLVPVNTNYRYGDDELSYLWENADAVAVVFHGTFADRIEGILDRVPGVKGWLWVDDGSGPCPDWATPYDDAREVGHRPDARARGAAAATTSTCSTRAAPRACPRASCGARTTSSPGSSTAACATTPSTAGIDGGARPRSRPSPTGVTLLPACPLMHGTGGFTANTVLAEGGRVVPAREPQVRPRRDARHDRAREGQRPGHRRRPLLAPAPGRARRATRARGT